MLKKHRELTWLGGGVFLLVALSFVVPIFGFWVVDNGSKYLQVVNIADHHQFRDFSIDYPLKQWDPEFVLNDATRYQLVPINGRLYTQYPPEFAYLTAFLYKLVGNYALRIVPLVSAIVLMFLVYLLARQCGVPRPEIAALLAIFATPLLPYAFEFWDMLPAMVPAIATLVVLGIGADSRCGSWRFAMGAGLCAGAAFALREQYLLWGLCITAFLFLQKPRDHRIWLSFASGWAIVCCGIMLLHMRLIDHPLFVQIWTSHSDNPVQSWNWKTRLVTFKRYVSKFSSYDVFRKGDDLVDWILLLGVFSLGFVGTRRRLAPIAAFAGLICVVLIHAVTWGYQQPLAGQFHFNSFLVSSPLIFIAAAFRPGDNGDVAEAPRRFWRVVLAVTLLFVAGSIFTSPLNSAIGLNFGPRMLLIAYPVLTIGAWGVIQAAWERAKSSPVEEALREGQVRWPLIANRITQACLLVLIGAGLGDSMIYVHRLYIKKRLSAGILKVIKDAAPMPVLTSVQWMTPELSPVYYERPIMFFETPEQQRLALQVSKKINAEAALLVTPRGPLKDLLNEAALTPLKKSQMPRFPDNFFSFEANIVRWKR